MGYGSQTYGASSYTSPTSIPSQYGWQLGGHGSNTIVYANGRLNGYSNPSRGETRTYEFYFQDDTNLGDGGDRYRAIREYGYYPQQVSVIESEDGTPYFRERVDASPKDTHVIPIIPGDGVNDVGVWAAVQSVSEEIPVNPESFARLSMEVVILAEYSEYDDRDAIGAALERFP